MKTRIRVVTRRDGKQYFYPEYKGLVFWNNLYDSPYSHCSDAADYAEKQHCIECDEHLCASVANAKLVIDRAIERRDRILQLEVVGTHIIKYP